MKGGARFAATLERVEGGNGAHQVRRSQDAQNGGHQEVGSTELVFQVIALFKTIGQAVEPPLHDRRHRLLKGTRLRDFHLLELIQKHHRRLNGVERSEDPGLYPRAPLRLRGKEPLAAFGYVEHDRTAYRRVRKNRATSDAWLRSIGIIGN